MGERDKTASPSVIDVWIGAALFLGTSDRKTSGRRQRPCRASDSYEIGQHRKVPLAIYLLGTARHNSTHADDGGSTGFTLVFLPEVERQLCREQRASMAADSPKICFSPDMIAVTLAANAGPTVRTVYPSTTLADFSD